MDDDKIMEEEEEEEKEHFFSDIVPSDRDREEEEDEDMDEESLDTAEEPLEASISSTPAPDQKAPISASPYTFTPLSSPTRPKTPSSVSTAQRGSTSKKPQLVPMKNGAFGAGANTSKVLKDDIVTHLPNELVDALMNTVQTLDKIILGVEDFKPDQLGFLVENVNLYVDLLKKVDAAGANYNALIPLQVLEMIDNEENSNPELFTKAQLEKCQQESERASGKVDTLKRLKQELEIGFTQIQ